jgi:hypothetical protein
MLRLMGARLEERSERGRHEGRERQVLTEGEGTNDGLDK